MTSAPAIGFEYRPSLLLKRAVFLVAILTLLAVALCALSPWPKLLLAAGVSLATWQSIRRLAVTSIAAAGWSADNGWTLRMTDHDDVPATLASFRIFGALVLLRLQTAERGMQVLLLGPDNSDVDIRRRLRMRLAVAQSDEPASRL